MENMGANQKAEPTTVENRMTNHSQVAELGSNQKTFPIPRLMESDNICPAGFQNHMDPYMCLSFFHFGNGNVYCIYLLPVSPLHVECVGADNLFLAFKSLHQEESHPDLKIMRTWISSLLP